MSLPVYLPQAFSCPFEEGTWAFACVRVEHQLDVAQNLVFDPFHRVAGEPLVAGVLDGPHRGSRTLGQLGRKLVGPGFEFCFRKNLGGYAQFLRFIRQHCLAK